MRGEGLDLPAARRDRQAGFRRRSAPNGLLRDYFPKGTDFKPIPQARLDAVAAELTGRPRMTFGWVPPAEKFAEADALTP